MDYTRQEILLTSAQWYLNQNIKINLLSVGEKSNIPVGSEAASKARVIDWVAQGGNLGFQPGDDLLIIDVDVKDGKEGNKHYTRLGLPKTRVVLTPSGGFHFYFRKPPGVDKCKAHLTDFPGIDFLSGPKNVVMPGSVLRNGVGDSVYSVGHDVDVVELPYDNPLWAMLSYSAGNALNNNHDQMTLERVTGLVEQLRNDDYDYADWFSVIASIHCETLGSDGGAELAMKWSRQSDKHTDQRFWKSWNSLSLDRDNMRTGATLVQRLKDQTPRFSDIKGAVLAPGAPELGADSPQFGGSMELLTSVTVGPEAPIPTSREGLLPGIAGQIESWADEQARFETPEMCRVAALHCLSALADNRYVVGEENTALNLYSLVVAETGRGKENVRHVISKFLRYAMPDITDDKGVHPVCVEKISSASGLLKMLTKRATRVWLIDEFGLFLDNTKEGRYADVIHAFMSSFSKPRGRVDAQQFAQGKDCSDPVEQPFLSAMATTTPETMSTAMEGSQFIESGLINRSVPVICGAVGERRRGVKPVSIPGEVQLWVQAFAARSEPYTREKPCVIPIDQDADDRLWAFALECDARTEVTALWNRGYENALKLCGIVALGLDVPRVDLSIAEWAIVAVSEGYTAFLAMYRQHSGRDSASEHAQGRIEVGIKALIMKPHKRFKLYPDSEAETAWKAGMVSENLLGFTLNASRHKDHENHLQALEAQGKIIRTTVINNPSPKAKPMKMVGLSRFSEC